MIFFKKHTKPTFRLKDLLQKATYVRIAFDRLKLGVDNIRYDVHLSPKFCSIASKLAFQFIALAAHIEDGVDIGTQSDRTDLRNAFKQVCRDVLFSGFRQARDFKEIQIDMLAQVALYKFLIQEIRDQFEGLCRHLKKGIRETETPSTFNHMENIRLKKVLSDIFKNRQSILRSVSKDLFQLVEEIQRDPLRKYRESAFGAESILPDNFFNNPLICGDVLPEDLFMISEYLLFGHRYEDANRYDALIVLVKRLLMECDTDAEMSESSPPKEKDLLLDEWIGEPENMDRLFNVEEYPNRRTELKVHGYPKDEVLSLTQRAAAKKSLLRFFYERFQKIGLIPIVAASYEIQPGFLEYCPPLTPQVVMQFMVNPRSREIVLDRLRRLSKKENRSYSADALWKIARRIRRLNRRQKEAYLLRFLRDLSRYHRDLKNATRTREAMDAVHLVIEEKVLNLSRVNNLLYEFLLPEEDTEDHSPIINHVVLKADVRGSTEIVRQMKGKGLNPASFFSLNFFEPINRLLETYEAEKVFIEGDAIILTILERFQPAKNLFTVARACGLAMDILSVVRRCNAGSRKAQLPVIELGIGIGFQNGPPTYLFDGNRRIMISSAINKAHSLCRSDKRLMQTGTWKPRFNLVVFKPEKADHTAEDASALPLIYNVNGIALDNAGFGQLSLEVNLKTLEYTMPDLKSERLRFHVGKFPTSLGTKRTLVIREAPFFTPGSPGPGAISTFEQVYYEVCTYSAILAWAEHFP